jgi:hypothetical protein
MLGTRVTLVPNITKQPVLTRVNLIRYVAYLSLLLLTMIATADLESAIRTAIPVSHLEIIDQSNGCGENYAILVVSEVRRGFFFV